MEGEPQNNNQEMQTPAAPEPAANGHRALVMVGIGAVLIVIVFVLLDMITGGMSFKMPGATPTTDQTVPELTPEQKGAFLEEVQARVQDESTTTIPVEEKLNFLEETAARVQAEEGADTMTVEEKKAFLEEVSARQE